MLKSAQEEFLQNTLIVDDLVDTGKTFEFLKPLTLDCFFVTLYAKPQGARYSDLYIRKYAQNDWISFPWESL